MPNDITVTKNTTSGSERWDVAYTADQAATVTKTLDTAETILDRDIKVSITTPQGEVRPASSISGSSATVSTGTNTLTLSKTISNTPSVKNAGYVSAGTAGNTSVSLTASVNTRSSSDLSASGATVTAPAGYYASDASKSISDATLTGQSLIGYSGATISTSSNAIYLSTSNALHAVTSSGGYVSQGNKAIYSDITLSATCAINNSNSLTVSGDTVTAPAGYYGSDATKTISSGTEGTPSISSSSPSYSKTLTGTTDFSGNYSWEIFLADYTVFKTYEGASFNITINDTTETIQMEESSSGVYSLESNDSSWIISYTTTQQGYAINLTNYTASTAVNIYITTESLKKLTPSVTNTEGYISGGTHKGSSVFVGISDFVSGTTTINSNGVKDVSEYAKADIQVPSYKLIKTAEYTVSTTSTTATDIGTMALGSQYYTSDKIIYVKVRDKAGIRNGYFAGSDSYFFNYYAANSATTTLTYAARVIHTVNSSGSHAQYVGATTTGYGVYPYSIDSSGNLVMRRRYSSSYSLTINGTYMVEVYTLDYVPYMGNPFDYSYTTPTGTGVLTNLIEDQQFQSLYNTFWSSYNSTLTFDTTNSTGNVTATSNYATWPQLSHDNVVVQSGHVYYIRCDMYYDYSGTPYGNGEMSFHTNDWSTSLVASYTNIGQWETISAYGVYNSTTGNLNLTLPTQNSSGNGIANLQVSWKNVMFVDLTEGYDYGNEPSKAWCDANLPYFYGTYTIPS